MSNKKNIESICEIISSDSYILMRDFAEIEKLQSADLNTIEKFTVASYRKFTQKIISKITGLVSAYKIKLPVTVPCLYNGIQQLLPINSIIETKEFDKIGDENIGFFMISPMDGMVNFTRSISVFCCSVAIFVNEDEKIVPRQALVYDIPNNRFYTATYDSGAFLNNTKLTLSNKSKIYTSTISISGLETFIKENQNNQEAMKLASKIKNISIIAANHLSGVPSQLAACYLASGKVDIVIEANLKDPTCIIGGLIIAKESGCCILNQNGQEITIQEVLNGNEKTIILTNRKVIEEVKKAFVSI